jgi:hypothetical protein
VRPIDRFWPDEPWDRYLPKKKSFLTDFVFYTRGVAAPTSFAFWTAVAITAAAIKRQAWLPWGYDKLYPNFYIILVSPPGIAKKGTVMNKGVNLLLKCCDHIKDPNMRLAKKFKIIRNKSTMEKMANMMLPEKKMYPLFAAGNKPLLDESGKRVFYHPTSESFIILPELENMLGRQEYNRGMTGFLMDIYDTLDEWDVSTMSRGTEKLKNLCTTILGGTTPMGLKKSVSEVALEDGFLCRSTLIFQARSTRRYSMPKIVTGGPTPKDMEERLAFIAEYARTEYILSPEAMKFYDKWYNNFMDELENKAEHAYAFSRKDIQVLKLALIIKASQYDLDKTISIEDIKDAINIMEKTSLSYSTLFSSVDGNAFMSKIDKVADYIRRRKSTTRGKILSNCRVTADEAGSAINNLLQAGSIAVYRDGRKCQFPGRESGEEYKWIGIDESDDDEDVEK